MKYRRVPLIATLTLLVACGDKSPTDVNAAVSGTVSFDYTGAAGGPFTATGGISSLSTPTANTTPWATGWNDASDNSTNIVANIPRTGGLTDFAVIIINSRTTGVSDIAPTCAPTTTTACNIVGLFMGAGANGSSPSTICFLDSGTITISSISSTNATGSFLGSGTCISSANPGVPTVFTVTNGSFNVPLQAIAPL